MRTILIRKDDQDYTRDVITWLRDFEHQAGAGLIEEIDPETTEGENLVETYDLLEYPAIMVLAEDGSVVQMWKGMPLPSPDMVSYFARQ